VAPSIAFAAPSPQPDTAAATAIVQPKHGLQATFHQATVDHGADRSALQPPGGGCKLGDVHGNWEWYYEGHILANLLYNYGSSIRCIPTGPGQSMASLSTQAFMFHDGHPVATGKRYSCAYPPPPGCNLVPPKLLDDSGTCLGVVCAGSYTVSAVDYLELPAGYIWDKWPSICRPPLPETPEVLVCVPATEPAIIPAHDVTVQHQNDRTVVVARHPSPR